MARRGKHHGVRPGSRTHTAPKDVPAPGTQDSREVTKSDVLLLIICSNTKAPNTNALPYSSPAGYGAIGPFLDRTERQRLYGARRAIRDLIKGTTLSRNGVQLSRLPYNDHLIDGPDFRPEAPPGGVVYLSAARRYSGRFYEQLGDKRLDLLGYGAQHHVLIVSGLYGLLTPDEQIQLYSCHIPDSERISATWRGVLTDVLVAYIRKHHITTVFDFMAVDAYRQLIRWGEIQDVSNILHAFTDMFAGDAQLQPFANGVRDFLETPADRLHRLTHGCTWPVERFGTKILFESMPTARTSNVPIEIPSQQSHIKSSNLSLEFKWANEIGQIRRMIIRMTDLIRNSRTHIDFNARIELLATTYRLDLDTKRGLCWFADLRNRVEYHWYKPTEEDMQKVRDQYSAFRRWAYKYHKKALGGTGLDAVFE